MANQMKKSDRQWKQLPILLCMNLTTENPSVEDKKTEVKVL
jgi:hypothetical protein